MLLPWLKVNKKQSSNALRGCPIIIAELILHGTLWYLTGGSVYDIQVCA
jgi:hypothetical protein